jgi:hypothetical protein
MDVGRRLKLGLLALVAMIGATLVITTVAQARSIPDPMLSNVPYLAWRGEAVRLVKCVPPSFLPAGYVPSSLDAGFTLVDWSGDPHLATPQVVTGAPGFNSAMFSVRGFDGAYCWGQSFISQKAGLAVIKMTVRDGTAGPYILTHDFYVGWMNLNSIVLCDNSGPGLCAGPSTGPITHVPGELTPNVLEANVTGNIPLLQDFNELGIGHSITLPDTTTAPGLVMPDDWATLAHAIASVRGTGADPAQFWDIHDDTLDTEGHAQESPAAVCQPRVATGIDAVDQCTDAGSLATSDETGPFSSIWAQLIGPIAGGGTDDNAYGPFDPTRAAGTEVSDGKLDAGDAPMPAARIDFTIAANTGGPTDISGVGLFTKIDKGLCFGDSALNDAGGEPVAPYGCTDSIYVRPGATTPHHLYAPFYRAYLPATLAPADPFSSGIDGGFANNFNGFLNLNGNALADPSGLYDYWDIAEVLRTAGGEDTNCLDRFLNGTPVFQTLPAGPQSVVVYSDEHGEARTGFLPGTGFFFDNFGLQNANLGCDLAGISPLGTASITATARYPYEPVTAQPLVSNAVAKSVSSLFVKLIQCYPKGPSAFDQQTAVCVAHAQDIQGHAITGERVCFFADNNSEGLFLPPVSPITIPNQTTWPPIFIIPAGGLGAPNIANCALTDLNGNTAIEVLNSNATTVNVTAFFVDEGLMRSVHVTFPITAPTAAVTGPVAGSHSNNNTTTTIVNPQTQTTTTVDSSHADPTVRVNYRITIARLSGRVLRVKLTGPAGNARLAISYQGRASKQVGALVKVVPANRVVKLRLQIPKKVRSIHLSVIPG